MPRDTVRGNLPACFLSRLSRGGEGGKNAKEVLREVDERVRGEAVEDRVLTMFAEETWKDSTGFIRPVHAE